MPWNHYRGRHNRGRPPAPVGAGSGNRGGGVLAGSAAMQKKSFSLVNLPDGSNGVINVRAARKHDRPEQLL